VREEWRQEAERCWGAGPDGLAPGFIAEMAMASGKGDESGGEEQPWRRLPGERQAALSAPALATHQDSMIYYYSGKQAMDTPDVCAKDYAMAMQFFSEGLEGDAAVLDLCCGDGLMARRFAQSGSFRRVFGADLNRKQLQAARRAAEEERTSPEDGLFLLRADVQALPLREEQVDRAWWGMGLHMVDDPGAAFREIFRVLRPGGRLVATTLSESFIPEELARLATEAGFTNLQLKVPRYSIYALLAVKP